MMVGDAADIPLESLTITQMNSNAGRRIHRLLQSIFEAEICV